MILKWFNSGLIVCYEKFTLKRDLFAATLILALSSSFSSSAFKKEELCYMHNYILQKL